MFAEQIAAASPGARACSPVPQCPRLMEFAIFNRSRFPYFSIWSQTPSARPYRSCNRREFAIVFIVCANRSKPVRRARSSSFRSIHSV